MTTVVDRAFEIAAATFPRAPRDGLAHPFGFDRHEPYCWRVSRDVWEELRAHVGWYVPEEPSDESRLLGEYIEVDDGLPPNSMLLEPDRQPVRQPEP